VRETLDVEDLKRRFRGMNTRALKTEIFLRQLPIGGAPTAANDGSEVEKGGLGDFHQNERFWRE
jgi:hypothetical protein